MARGLESLELELERRRGRPAGRPPEPVGALRSMGILLAGSALAVAAAVVATGVAAGLEPLLRIFGP